MSMLLLSIAQVLTLYWQQEAVVQLQFTQLLTGPVSTISVISQEVVGMVHLVVAVRGMLHGLKMNPRFTSAADIMVHSIRSILRMLSSGWVAM